MSTWLKLDNVSNLSWLCWGASQVVHHAFFFLSLLACLRFFVLAECVMCFGWVYFFCFTIFLVSCFNWCLDVSIFECCFQAAQTVYCLKYRSDLFHIVLFWFFSGFRVLSGGVRWFFFDVKEEMSAISGGLWRVSVITRSFLMDCKGVCLLCKIRDILQIQHAMPNVLKILGQGEPHRPCFASFQLRNPIITEKASKRLFPIRTSSSRCVSSSFMSFWRRGVVSLFWSFDQVLQIALGCSSL